MNVVPIKSAPAADPLTDEDINFGPSPEDASPLRVPDSWRLLDDVELLELPDPKFLIDGILADRGVAVLYSPVSSGKTTLGASMAVSVATGLDWFGHRVTNPGAVVYVGAEDPGGFKIRLRAAKRAAQLSLTKPIGVFTFPEAINLRDPVRSICSNASCYSRPKVYGSRSSWWTPTPRARSAPNESSAEDTGLAMSHAQQWRDRLHVTVLLIHHTNAAGSQGTGPQRDAGRGRLHDRHEPLDDVVHVEVNKQRNGRNQLHPRIRAGPDGRAASFGSRPMSSRQDPLDRASQGLPRAPRELRRRWGDQKRVAAQLSGRPRTHVLPRLQGAHEAGYIALVGSHFRLTSKVPTCP